MLKLCVVVLIACLSLFSNLGFADTVRLHVPTMQESPNQHRFFHELLSRALSDISIDYELIIEEYPQQRIKRYLDIGRVSIFWLVESAKRNVEYKPIEVGLTNGLIGKRVLLIPQGKQYLYDQVYSLRDFRNLELVGGFGQSWFDVDVWKANDLRYMEQSGDWKSIFKMLAVGRSFDYFSRGVIEIMNEAKQYPNLDIETRLLFIYDRDFRFYLSTKGENAGAKYYSTLTRAVDQAKRSGLMESLVRKHWEDDFQILNYDKRVKVYLKTPR